MSIATVSRALNHRPGISAERAEWIRQVAKELGYLPNDAARALKTNRTNIIGILYHNRMAHEFFSVVLEGLHNEATRCGYEITFLNSTKDTTAYDHARRRQCAGVLLVQGDDEANKAAQAISACMPVVTLDQPFQGSTTVMSDNVSAMEQLVHYVHQRGHSRIAFIHGEIAGQVTRDRLTGFYRGCRDCGIQVEDGYVIEAKYRNPDTAEAATRQLLALPKPPTCIFYPDDMSYLGGQAEIDRQGLRIPQDISCVGFDGIMLSGMLRPPLTTYYQDAEAMGQRAMSELIAAIEDSRCAIAQTLLVPGHLLEGGTVLDLTQNEGESP